MGDGESEREVGGPSEKRRWKHERRMKKVGKEIEGERDSGDLMNGGLREGCPGGTSMCLDEESMSWMLEMDSGVTLLLVCGYLLCHTHSYTHTVYTVRSRPSVAKVAMATSHQNGNYN